MIYYSNCIVCGKKIENRRDYAKTCSQKCASERNRQLAKLKYHKREKRKIICQSCGKTFLTSRGRIKYCNFCRPISYKNIAKKWRRENGEKIKIYNKTRNLLRIQNKKIVFAHYKPICACCGETNIDVLTVDHKFGRHNEKISGLVLYRYIIKNNFPNRFQILCFNCNHAKSNIYDLFCPAHHPELYLTEKISSSSKKQYRNLKNEVLIHYGGNPPKCNYCGESHIEFLEIDHILNNGVKDRKLHGHGTTFYFWLRKSNFPEGYQVLCSNCNFLKFKLKKSK